MTLVILLLALLALVAGSRSEPSAQAASPETVETANAQAQSKERHETNEGLSSQPLLSRPGVVPGKARPQMTSIAQSIRSPWQGAALVALNLPSLKGLKAINARIPSGVRLARASTRAS